MEEKESFADEIEIGNISKDHARLAERNILRKHLSQRQPGRLGNPKGQNKDPELTRNWLLPIPCNLDRPLAGIDIAVGIEGVWVRALKADLAVGVAFSPVGIELPPISLFIGSHAGLGERSRHPGDLDKFRRRFSASSKTRNQ